MALPALTMQASSTSQLQTTPIFSLIASTTALNPSNRRIPLPCASYCCRSPVLANGGLLINAGCESALALGTVTAEQGGRQVAPPDYDCLGGRQLGPTLGTEELQRAEGALVGHLARIGDLVTQIDIGQPAPRRGIGQPQDHMRAQSPPWVLRIEEAVDRRNAARQPVDQAGAAQPASGRIVPDPADPGSAR